tara:strand:+ start:195 stop:461 length:267 start_codon:yes stop_codon:yes gene_type:complete
MPITYIHNSDFMNYDAFKVNLIITEGTRKEMECCGFTDWRKWRKFLKENDVDWEEYLLKRMIEDKYVECVHHVKENILYFRLLKYDVD